MFYALLESAIADHIPTVTIRRRTPWFDQAVRAVLRLKEVTEKPLKIDGRLKSSNYQKAASGSLKTATWGLARSICLCLGIVSSAKRKVLTYRIAIQAGKQTTTLNQEKAVQNLGKLEILRTPHETHRGLKNQPKTLLAFVKCGKKKSCTSGFF